jgi:predicted SAM-dependent methyltransferase
MKIHLGCGVRYIDGWENVDWSDKYKVDHKLDIGTEPLPFEDGVASNVISSHLIEHLTRWEGIHHLKEILRVLKPGGELVLAFPDIIRILDCFEGRDKSVDVAGNHDWLILCLFETQKDETIIHKYGYTKKTLTKLLKQLGFSTVEEQKEEVIINGKKVCDYRYAITILKVTK